MKIAFIGTVNFNGKHGCQKCEVSGEFRNRMSFPTLNATLRTDHSFRDRKQLEHHKDRSILEDLPINMIDNFPVSDALHLIEHGVMKKLLSLWIKGATLCIAKFKKQDIQNLDKMLYEANKQMPSDIHRAVRGISYWKYWKGTEFRTFLLYIGVVILKDHLPSENYDNFLLFFCAVRICSCEKYTEIARLSEALFCEFVQNFGLIYGNDHIVSNVHNLIHVYSDVKLFGNLNTLSAYRFENCLRHLKLRVQTQDAPLEQIARRIIEAADNRESQYFVLDSQNSEPKLKYPSDRKHNNGFTTYKYIEICSEVFFSVKRIGDSFFLTKDKQIVQMNFAFSLNDEYFIEGRTFLTKRSFF